MKTTLSLFLVCCLLAETGRDVFAQTASHTLIDDLPAEPQLMDAYLVPVAGTFFMLSDFQSEVSPPPYPCNPFFDAAVYSTAAEGIYIVDDSEARPSVFQAVANVDLATLEIWGRVDDLVNHIQDLRLERESATALSVLNGEMMLMGGEGGESQFAMSYSPDTLWLEITGITNGNISLTVHGTIADASYEILSKEALEATDWLSEGSPILGLDGETPTTIAMGVRKR